MGSETSELTRQLIEIESNMIIDIGRALRSAARIGPAGDMTSIQEGMREKLPEADRKWQYALNELEMQILDAKAVLTRDLERIQPRGNTSITHKFLKGPIAPVFTMPPPPKEVTPPVNQMAPTPVPMSASQSHQSAPTASNTGTYKNTPVPPPVIPPGAIPMAPSNSTGSYSEPMTGSLSMTPIPVPPAGRNASPLTAKKDATGNRGVKASPAIGKAAPNKKGSPALTKAQVAKVSKSPNKKNSPAISKSTPSASKASPAVAKANLIKANMRKDSPAPATETGYTAGFGLPEQKQTPIPPPQIPVLATKPKAQKKKPAPKKATPPAPQPTTQPTQTPIVPPPVTTMGMNQHPQQPGNMALGMSMQMPINVDFSPMEQPGNMYMGNNPSSQPASNGNSGQFGSGMTLDMPISGPEMMGMGMGGDMDMGAPDMADLGDDFFKIS